MTLMSQHLVNKSTLLSLPLQHGTTMRPEKTSYAAQGPATITAGSIAISRTLNEHSEVDWGRLGAESRWKHSILMDSL
jgi:hypothetical protein